MQSFPDQGLNLCPLHWGFPAGSTVNNPFAMQETQELQLPSLAWEDPLEEGMQPTPVFLPRESHGQQSLVGYGPRGHKESDMT